ncbi:PREDICTED: uncharacterized protein LOC107169351 [Diuraphis noxia]|uniref:uncharacterized protein LOC107169351 n=1 Tax=Diuraphis noxia TaxID=143948 RepID=UPI0007635695|nr:PREDICTED: uncharacterized protein LOC107169351 [Diuraphis noxia]
MTTVLKNHHELFDLLPNEIVSHVLIFIDWDTLFVCRLVCKKWQQLIDTYVFQEKTAIENKFANDGRGYYSFSQIGSNSVRSLDLPWYVFYLIGKYDPFNKNLVKNSCGQGKGHWDGPGEVNFINKFTLWSNLSLWTDFKLSPLTTPTELIEDPDLNGYKLYFTTPLYNFYSMYQKIVFKDHGLNQNVMKSLQPEIIFSAWIKNGCYRHYKYILQVILHDELENTIAEHNVRSPEIQRQWVKTSSSLKMMGNESSITLHHKIDDRSKYLCDYQDNPYNLKITCSVVKILLPTEFKLKLPEPKMHIFN